MSQASRKSTGRQRLSEKANIYEGPDRRKIGEKGER
jgi:hypothetical protein